MLFRSARGSLRARGVGCPAGARDRWNACDACGVRSRRVIHRLCKIRRFRVSFPPFPVKGRAVGGQAGRSASAVRVRDTVKVEESFCGPPWLSIMIGSVLTGPGASIQPTISGA